MPSRTISYLSLACTALFAAYLALVATTLYFAALRTELVAEIDRKESEVAALETAYYDAVARISGADVAALGFAAPSSVVYLTRSGDAALSRASR